MANPGTVSVGGTITSDWANAVVSRVVGIYATLAAAELDGRTDDGALVTLTDGSLWLRDGTDWHRISPVTRGDEIAGYALTTGDAQVYHTVGVADKGDESPVRVAAYLVTNVDVVVAAKVEIAIAISHTGGSTWNQGPWFSANLPVGKSVLAAAHQRQDVAPTGDIQARCLVKATPLATYGDVALGSGHLQTTVFPSLAGAVA